MSFDGLFDDLEARGTKPYTLPCVRVRSEREVVLHLKHAGHGNTAYRNAKRKLDQSMRGRVPTDQEVLEALIPLFAAHVIAGWDHVHEPDGTPVKATPAKIGEFLSALVKKAPDKLDAAFGYALNPENYRDIVLGGADDLGNG